MAENSKIEWTDATWNPVTGCSKISMGCTNCYAERLANRLCSMGQLRYRNGFAVTLHYDLIERPLQWRKPRRIFVNSMSDLFHEDIPLDFIQQVFQTMQQCPHHIFQVLTKRSARLHKISHRLKWPSNVWMGVTVEHGSLLHRVEDLRQTPATVRFLSCEPLLGPLYNLPLEDIHWVIVGGESGPGAREMRPEWVENILHQCKKQETPFFFKQWGGIRKHRMGRLLCGKTYDEAPRVTGQSNIYTC